MASVLEQLALDLTQADIELQYVSAGYQDLPFDQLFVALDEDIEKEELDYVLQLYRPLDILQSEAQYADLANEFDDFYSLVFKLSIPTILNRKRELETYQMMAFLNQLLPMGYFDLDLNDYEINYQYALSSERNEIDAVLIADMLDKLAFFLPRMGSKLVELHESNKSLAHLIEELVTSLHGIRTQTTPSA